LSIAVVVEGDTDLPFVRKLIDDAGLESWTEIDCGGKSQLDQDLPGYNNAAKGSPWFVLRDLDHDAPCAGGFIETLAFTFSKWMCFRLAVRELEAWLLADREGVATFFSIKLSEIPESPEREEDPTRTLVNLARRSRSKKIQRAMVPKPGTAVAIGPLYEAMIIEFGERHWSLERASQRSASLSRARERLREIARLWNET
jgi:hypothetical protein